MLSVNVKTILVSLVTLMPFFVYGCGGGGGGNGGSPTVVSISQQSLSPPELSSTQNVLQEGERVSLSWTHNEDEEVSGYELERCSTGDCLTIRQSSMSFESILFVGEYTFRVRAINGDVEGEWSTRLTITVNVRPSLNAPTFSSTQETLLEGEGVSLSWTHNGNGVSGYELEQCSTGGCLTIRQSGTSFQDILLVGAYTFRVRAINEHVEGEWSTRLTITVRMRPSLSAPTFSPIQETLLEGEGVSLSWTHNGNGVSGYELEQCSTGGCLTIRQSGTSFQGILPVGAYTFRVRAINEHVEGEWSTRLTITVNMRPPLGPPTGVVVTVDGQDVMVSWVAPEHTGGSSLLGYSVVIASTCAAALVSGVSVEVTATEYTFAAGFEVQGVVVIGVRNEAGETATANCLSYQTGPSVCAPWDDAQEPDCTPLPSNLLGRRRMIEVLTERDQLYQITPVTFTKVDSTNPSSGTQEIKRFAIIDLDDGHGDNVLRTFCYHRIGNCVSDSQSTEHPVLSITPEQAKTFVDYHEVQVRIGLFGVSVNPADIKNSYKSLDAEQIVSISLGAVLSNVLSDRINSQDLRDGPFLLLAASNEGGLAGPDDPNALAVHIVPTLQGVDKVSVDLLNGETMEVPKALFIAGHGYTYLIPDSGSSGCAGFEDSCLRGPFLAYTYDSQLDISSITGNSYAAPAILATLEGTARIWPDLESKELLALLIHCTSIPDSATGTEAQQRAVWGLGVPDLACLAEPQGGLFVSRGRSLTGTPLASARDVVVRVLDNFRRGFTVEMGDSTHSVTMRHFLFSSVISGMGTTSMLGRTAFRQSMLPLVRTELGSGLNLLALFTRNGDTLPRATGMALTYTTSRITGSLVGTYGISETFFGVNAGTGSFDPGTIGEVMLGTSGSYTHKEFHFSIGLNLTHQYASGNDLVDGLSGTGLAVQAGMRVQVTESTQLQFALTHARMLDTQYSIGGRSFPIRENTDTSVGLELLVKF